jgi:hypothetical protein
VNAKPTKIHLTSPHGLIIGKPEIMWPPESGEPDVIRAASKVFVRVHGAKGLPPTYREASVIGITNIDF